MLPLAFALAPCALLSSQEQPGAIAGVVTDSAGQPLRGAAIRISGTEIRRVSDASGRFLFERLRPGGYVVTASWIGAAPARDSTVVRAADTARMRFRLRLVPFRLETLPPRVRPGSSADTVAVSPETDSVALAIGAGLLHPAPRVRARRELRLWRGFGLGVPMQLVRLTDERGHVKGELWHWIVENLPDASAPASYREFLDSLPPWLRHEWRCGTVAVDTLQSEKYGGPGRAMAVTCRVDFRSPPDWGAFLRRLERLHVWTLPDEDELPQYNVVTSDGIGLVVEAWDGSRYRSYHFGNPDHQPSREARDANAILGLIRDLVARSRLPRN